MSESIIVECVIYPETRGMVIRSDSRMELNIPVIVCHLDGREVPGILRGSVGRGGPYTWDGVQGSTRCGDTTSENLNKFYYRLGGGADNSMTVYVEGGV